MSGGPQKHIKLHNALMLEPRLASADKKSTFEIQKMNNNNNNSVTSSSGIGFSSRLINEGGIRHSGAINRDRFVAHRRIDLICDDTADSHSLGNTKGSLSNSLFRDHNNTSSMSKYAGGPLQTQTRKKSDSVSSQNDKSGNTVKTSTGAGGAQ